MIAERAAGFTGRFVAATMSEVRETRSRKKRDRLRVGDRVKPPHLLSIEQRLRLDRMPERTVDLQEVLAPGE